jgi:hypothetical protein
MRLLRSKGSGVDSQSATVWPGAEADGSDAGVGGAGAGAHAPTTATVAVASRATTVRDMKALLMTMESNQAGVKVRRNSTVTLEPEVPPIYLNINRRGLRLSTRKDVRDRQHTRAAR